MNVVDGDVLSFHSLLEQNPTGGADAARAILRRVDRVIFLVYGVGPGLAHTAFLRHQHG